MGNVFESLNKNIQDHLKFIVKSGDLNENENSLEILAEAWKEKESSFTNQISKLEMEETDLIEIDDNSGFMVLTYSGSLIGSGPVIDGKRTVLYVSVGLRSDVPEKAEKEGSILGSDIREGEPVEFSVGPIKQSSPVYRIAKINDNIAIEDQAEQISEATLIVAEEFADVNKTVIL